MLFKNKSTCNQFLTTKNIKLHIDPLLSIWRTVHLINVFYREEEFRATVSMSRILNFVTDQCSN